jgi:2-keto-4-pentenoate hydratase/2-oxohepta-3-ene-1,7-dioic acid hydratase in catechol pathway
MTDYALVSFAMGCETRPGLVLEDVVYDLAAASGHPADTSMLSLLRDWSAAQARIQSAIDQASTGRLPGQALDTLKILAPLPVPGTLFCAGANYSDHVAEMAAVANIEPDPDPHSLGLGSWHFIKSSHSVIGPGDGIEIPSGSLKLDWEVELAVVIGQKTRNIAVDLALTCVAGYTVANDLSARDLSRRNGIAPHSPFRFDWLAHKSFDTACPLGPCIVPATQIPDPQSLDISLLVNGEMKQNSNTSRMIFTIAEQIADLSRRLTLWPGDVILSGTRVAGIGELNNVVL